MPRAPAREFTLNWILPIGAAFVLSWISRRPFWGGPFGTDEGAYVMVAREILRGHLPLGTAWINRLPLAFFPWVLSELIPACTDFQLDVAWWIFASLTAIGLFVLLRRSTGVLWAWFGLVLFSVVNADLGMWGHRAVPEGVMNMLLVWAIVFSWPPNEASRGFRPFWAGLLVGLASSIKEIGIPAGLACAYLIATGCRKDRIRRLVLFGVGVILPFALIALTYASLNRFDEIQAIVLFNSGYSRLRLKDLFAGPVLLATRAYVAYGTWPLWLLSLSGMLRLPWKSDFESGARIYLLTMLIAIVLPGYFRPYYYLLALPGIVLCSVLTLRDLGTPREASRAAGWLAAATMIFAVGVHASFASGHIPLEVRKLTYEEDLNLFLRDVGLDIEKVSAPNESLAAIGANNGDVLFLYSRLRPAQPDVWLLGTGWMGAPRARVKAWLTDRSLQAIERRPPDWIVLMGQPGGTGWTMVMGEPGTSRLEEKIVGMTTQGYREVHVPSQEKWHEKEPFSIRIFRRALGSHDAFRTS